MSDSIISENFSHASSSSSSSSSSLTVMTPPSPLRPPSGRISPLSGLSIPLPETPEVGWMAESSRRTSMTWKIPNYVGQDEHLNALASPVFTACGTQWFLKIHPKRKLVKDGPLWVGLFLCSDQAGCIVFSSYSVAFELGFLDADGTEYKCFKDSRLFARTNPSWGCDEFLPRRELLRNRSRLLPKDVLTIFCVVNVINKRDTTADNTLEGFTYISRNLKDLFRSGEGSDVCVKVLDKEFKAHKSILASRSPVFAAMFEHNMSESLSGIINITDCDPDVFEIFLTYLYSGQIENCSFSDIKNLYCISSKYDAKDLIDNCIFLLKTYLSAETFCELLLLSQLHSDKDLEREVLIFFISNMNDIVGMDRWSAFVSESPQIVNKLFLLLDNFQD